MNDEPLKGSEKNLGAVKENLGESGRHFGFGNIPIQHVQDMQSLQALPAFSAPLAPQYYADPILNSFLPLSQFSYQPIITNTNFQFQPILKETQILPTTMNAGNYIGARPEEFVHARASRELQELFQVQQAARDAEFPVEDEVKRRKERE